MNPTLPTHEAEVANIPRWSGFHVHSEVVFWRKT